MGKHNGKARKTAGPQKVGSALLSRNAQQTRGGGGEAAFRHTTDVGDATNMQSVIMENDLSELMRMADLAGRDFAGEKGNAVILSATNARVGHLSDEQRQAILERHPEAMRIPRRPLWNRGMTASQVQEQERASFLEWRRRLAGLESEEGLIVTPFEKNLEVWRQLWRVLERSDVIVQVVDARDPMFYRSEDLEGYARLLRPHARCLLLLNKADLLPDEIRTMWADYLDAKGVHYAFWSAFASTERQKREGTAAAQLLAAEAAENAEDSTVEEAVEESADKRIHVLTETELIALLGSQADEALRARPASGAQDADVSDHAEDANNGIADEVSAGEGDQGGAAPPAPPTVGLIGFPNVGKSSTINALFGSKKTAVAATPGKTKHFQTLFVTPELRLCDCPGLVMPRLATSTADMVAAGVVPIDRLTDVISSIAAIAARVSRHQMLAKLKISMPRPKPHEPQDQAPTAHEVLSAYAANRGWLNGSGLPDQTRSARALLKDYTAGRLVFCEWPPGQQRRCPLDEGLGVFTSQPVLLQFSAERAYGKNVKTALQPKVPRGAKSVAGGAGADELGEMSAGAAVSDSSKVQRSDHKFQKKAQKHAGVNARVLAKAGISPYGTFETAGAQDHIHTGKRGGIVRL